MGKLISVIIPVYNVEQYLPYCLDSIIQQTYRNLEILLIDDGSTDCSGAICENYALRDKRIKVIHKKNGGLSDARNKGLDICSGDYVSFVDADDYVGSDYIEQLYSAICETHAEIAVCDTYKFYDEAKLLSAIPQKGPKLLFSNIEALEDALYRRNLTFYANGKLYKNELFREIRFPYDRLFEDLYTTYKVIYRANQVVYLPLPNYFYRQRTGSIVNSSFQKKRMESVKACYEILNFVTQKRLPLVRAVESKIFISCIDLSRRIQDKEKYNEEWKFLYGEIKKYRWIVFKDSNNKYLVRIIAALSIVSPKITYVLGKLYGVLINRQIVKPLKPI